MAVKWWGEREEGGEESCDEAASASELRAWLRERHGRSWTSKVLVSEPSKTSLLTPGFGSISAEVWTILMVASSKARECFVRESNYSENLTYEKKRKTLVTNGDMHGS